VLGIHSVFPYLDLPFEAYIQFRYTKCNRSDCVSRLAFVSRVRVSYQAIPCGICGRQSYVLTEFSARNSAFLLFFRPTNVPYFIFIYLPSMMHVVSNYQRHYTKRFSSSTSDGNCSALPAPDTQVRSGRCY